MRGVQQIARRMDADGWAKRRRHAVASCRPVIGRSRAVALQQKRSVIGIPVRFPDKQQLVYTHLNHPQLAPAAYCFHNFRLQ